MELQPPLHKDCSTQQSGQRGPTSAAFTAVSIFASSHDGIVRPPLGDQSLDGAASALV